MTIHTVQTEGDVGIIIKKKGCCRLLSKLVIPTYKMETATDSSALRDSCNCAPLPLSVLRLMVPPVRLMSAAVWQTIQRKVVSEYGMLEEFVSMVTDILPDLLSTEQRAQLTLGLRAQVTLDLCQLEATANTEVVQPHLDRMQKLIEHWNTEVATSEPEASHSEFVDLVRNLLKNPDEREHFFKNVFPEEFGPIYQKDLCTLMWIFLSRLENCLPLQSFQQVAPMLAGEPSLLEDIVDAVLRREEFKLLLQNQKEHTGVDHDVASFDGVNITSALKLPPTKRPCTATMDMECLPPPSIIMFATSAGSKNDSGKIALCDGNWILGQRGSSGDETAPEDLRQDLDLPNCIKQCHVELKRLQPTASLRPLPQRRNRGLKMKRFLLEEKRRMEDITTNSSAPRKSVPTDSFYALERDSGEEESYMAPIIDSSEDDSWSYYSDVESNRDSASECSSWSYYSDDQREAGESDADSHGKVSSKTLSASGGSRSHDVSSTKAAGPKKAKMAKCCICKERLCTSLQVHMKTHFPNGYYACPQCDSRFKLYSSLKQHLNKTCFQQVDADKLGQDVTLFKCDKCDEAFLYKVTLEKHKVTHSELYCGVCRRVLRDAATVARHKASHTRFQCTRCDESFTFFKPLLRHCQNFHKLCRPFACAFCAKTYSRLRILIMHEWKHTGHLPFQCKLCSKRFKHDSDLMTHERVHTREKPYLCAECGKSFAHWSNLVRHRKLVHSKLHNEKRYSCSECQKSFKWKGSLKHHQRIKHRNEFYRRQCPYCGKMVSSSTIRRHELMHKGERPFKCTVPECDRKFRSNPEVKKHILMCHTTERPYKCDVCQKGFINQCFLNHHAAVHSGEKPFVCHICFKAFPRAYSMRRHIKLKHAFGKR